MGNKILLMGVFSHRLPRRFQMKQEFSAYQDQTGNSLVVLLPKEFSNCIFIYTVTSDYISNKTLFFNVFIYFLEVGWFRIFMFHMCSCVFLVLHCSVCSPPEAQFPSISAQWTPFTRFALPPPLPLPSGSHSAFTCLFLFGVFIYFCVC